MNQTYDVIIIGGGATGAGIARDCSLRGIKALLLERSDISTGRPDATTACSTAERVMPLRTTSRPWSASART